MYGQLQTDQSTISRPEAHSALFGKCRSSELSAIAEDILHTCNCCTMDWAASFKAVAVQTVCYN